MCTMEDGAVWLFACGPVCGWVGPEIDIGPRVARPAPGSCVESRVANGGATVAWGPAATMGVAEAVSTAMRRRARRRWQIAAHWCH